MMGAGWGFPWLVLIVPVVMGVLMVFRMSGGRGAMHPGCGMGTLRHGDERPAESPPPDDPMATLRERYVRGEIEIGEFERRLDGLLRSEPSGTSPERNP